MKILKKLFWMTVFMLWSIVAILFIAFINGIRNVANRMYMEERLNKIK